MTRNLCLRNDTNGEVVSDTRAIIPEKIATKDRRRTLRLSDLLDDEILRRVVAENKNASLVMREALIRGLFASDY